MTEPDGLERALRALVEGGRDDLAQLVVDALNGADGVDEEAQGLAAVTAVLNGTPLALNDDAGLAKRLGMPLSHDSHFGY